MFREYLKCLRHWPPQEKRKTQIRTILKDSIKQRIRNPPSEYVSNRQDFLDYLAKDLHSLRALTDEKIRKVSFIWSFLRSEAYKYPRSLPVNDCSGVILSLHLVSLSTQKGIIDSCKLLGSTGPSSYRLLLDKDAEEYISTRSSFFYAWVYITGTIDWYLRRFGFR